MQRPFENKTALVTGSSSGIGAATAIALAAQGADVLIHYNSNAQPAEFIMEQVMQQGVHAELLQADLSQEADVHQLVEQIKGRKIDILINNAGSLIKRTRVLDMTEDLWSKVMMLNLTSAFFISQGVIPGMLERKSGVIVNLSTVAALTGGGIGSFAYASAKGAVSTMTRGFAKEFASQGIRVNAISPGTVNTGYHRQFSTEQMLEGAKSATPLGRLGEPEDIAGAIVFLCSDAAAYIHGQVIEVNGGFYMG
jgi:3-oxoacyl-[acyl-carrier protein] reductase